MPPGEKWTIQVGYMNNLDNTWPCVVTSWVKLKWESPGLTMHRSNTSEHFLGTTYVVEIAMFEGGKVEPAELPRLCCPKPNLSSIKVRESKKENSAIFVLSRLVTMAKMNPEGKTKFLWSTSAAAHTIVGHRNQSRVTSDQCRQNRSNAPSSWGFCSACLSGPHPRISWQESLSPSSCPSTDMFDSHHTSTTFGCDTAVSEWATKGMVVFQLNCSILYFVKGRRIKICPATTNTTFIEIQTFWLSFASPNGVQIKRAEDLCHLFVRKRSFTFIDFLCLGGQSHVSWDHTFGDKAQYGMGWGNDSENQIFVNFQYNDLVSCHIGVLEQA